MYSTNFEIRGDQLIFDPAINSNSSTQMVRIEGGWVRYVPEITVRVYVNGVVDNEIGPNGSVYKFEIIDVKGNVVATYLPQNPGEVGNVQPDISGLGDEYIRFNTGPFKNEFGEMFGGSVAIVGCGYSGKNLPIELPRGDGMFDIGKCSIIVPCFVAGMNQIVTDRGLVSVECLGIGDLVLTYDNGFQPIRYISRRRHSGDAVIDDERLLPYVVSQESHEVFISKQHRILITDDDKNEYLMSANHFSKSFPTLCRIDYIWCSSIEYINIFFDNHEIVRVDNAIWVESGYLGGKYADNIVAPDFGIIDELKSKHTPARPFINHKLEIID